MRILSSFDHLVDPSTQQAIENASVNAGLEEAHLEWTNEGSGEDPIYDVYDENENYYFSIDTASDLIFEH